MNFRHTIPILISCGALLHPPTGRAASNSAPWEIEIAPVRQRVAALKQQLGHAAGVPEVADQFQSIPKDGRWLGREEARLEFQRLVAEAAQRRWWKTGLDPAGLDHALREPASVICGCVHQHRAGLRDRDASSRLSREAADFLLWAQSQAGTGVIPFPAYRGPTRDNALAAARRFLERSERAGKLDQVVRNGWIFEDGGDGGLQFDNGEAGVALFELYEVSGDTNLLAAAGNAADWSMSRPLAANWNYNSFSVYLLAKAFAITREQRYLGAATRKAFVGVIPGQLTEGPRTGRWLDPHNARPAYHYIMLRALAALAAVLPPEDSARPEIMRALKLGLQARNPDFLGPGAPNKDHAMEALLLVNRTFAADRQFLSETHSVAALEALGRLVSETARQGKMPLAPGPYGRFLEYVLWQTSH